MTDKTHLDEVNRKLDILLKLMAYQTVQKMTLSEGAPLLRRLGFNSAEIAEIYDSTSNAVNVRLAEAKKKKKDKQQKGGKVDTPSSQA
ncbi:MAG: hypothetical protein HS124_06790 [Anaerolineales bacterium]|nr:hypothetical protein [Anaerolineales bacterium]MCL4261545.1 hypothetical protein [Anaerolineales bacterium]